MAYHGSLVTGFKPMSAEGRLRSGVPSHAGRFWIVDRLFGDLNICLSSATSSSSERPIITCNRYGDGKGQVHAGLWDSGQLALGGEKVGFVWVHTECRYLERLYTAPPRPLVAVPTWMGELARDRSVSVL